MKFEQLPLSSNFNDAFTGSGSVRGGCHAAVFMDK